MPDDLDIDSFFDEIFEKEQEEIRKKKKLKKQRKDGKVLR